MMNTSCYQQLFKNIDPLNSLVLTPNKRLAARIHQEYARYQKQTVWQTPAILPLDTWLENCWQLLVTQGQTNGYLLLNNQQTQLIWQRLIKEDCTENLLNLNATCQQVNNAWQLLQQWQLDPSDPRLALTLDHRLFLKWVENYQQICLDNKYLDQASLSQWLSQSFNNLTLNPPSHIVLVSFTELRPDIDYLMTQLKNLACKINEWQPKIINLSKTTLSLPDKMEEITIVAKWAKTIHQQHPQSQIACIFQNITQDRQLIEQAFYETFGIDQQINNDLPFALSSGTRFVTIPIIHAALNCLQLKTKLIAFEKIKQFLYSPFFIAKEEELFQQVLFVSILQQTEQATFYTNQLFFHLKKFNAELCIHNALQVFLNEPIPNLQLPSQWAEYFSKLLQMVGWPGQRSLTSSEYQACQRWLRLLNELALLDTVSEPLTYSEALQLLTELAVDTIFQAESSQSHIQILGLLEAVGMTFDYIWVTGLDSKSWPPLANPHPLIPIALQRELNMPHCSAERELVFCQRLTEQLLTTCQHFIASYAEQDKEIILQKSPLLKDLPLSQLESLLPTEIKSIKRPLIEYFIDEQAPQVTADEKIKGGTGLLKRQAACPFRAFAEYRLLAKPIENYALGIDAKTKGKLIHKALELLWKQLNSQARLLTLTETKQNNLLYAVIEQTFQSINIPTQNYALISLEKTRLHKLLTEWLSYERKRPAFEVIATEKWQSVKLNELTLKVQVDRIDQTRQGSMILLDYKTGKTSINDWFSQRPNEPQLPLYTLVCSGPITAMAFAQLKADEIRFKGITLTTEGLPDCDLPEKIKDCLPNWENQLQLWRQTLLQLADDFIAGKALVDPKNPRETCQQCHLSSLCRVHETINID
ncbi:MAG: hypothetical protein A3E87_00655 [Gammaproteobacteria bacterium RIFCSPHIGHO2_12_FULL_35_23]|nr:MAG: hypothetical protein A3E87_00655 [Gammaproteobacteria bacterium RIFCSPHIGHO2_12_FULL_35_23]